MIKTHSKKLGAVGVVLASFSVFIFRSAAVPVPPEPPGEPIQSCHVNPKLPGC